METPASLSEPEPPFFYPTIRQAWSVILWYLLASIICCAPFIPFVIKFPDHQVPLLMSAAIISDVALAWFLIRKRTRQGDPGFRLSFRQTGISVFLLSLLALLSIILLEDPISLLHLPDFTEGVFEQLRTSPWIFMILVAVIGPVLEEIIFRGVVLDGLLKNYTPARSIVISSVIFALIHMNPAQIPGAFLIGLLLGWVYYKTRSLWPCMFIHIANNGLFTVLTYLFPQIKTTDSLWQLMDHKSYYFLMLLIAFMVLYISVRTLNRLVSPAQ